VGNSPYSGISSNNGEWITSLIEDYNYVDGKHFNERKHWLQDDYVKFIRFGQYFVEKNGEGVLAYINNNSFLDNPTFRGLRWNLLNSFDTIYIIDLHGNSKKKDKAPDGSPDKNVFDIQQGVSINIFVKNGKVKKGGLAKVKHVGFSGSREYKYDILEKSNLRTLKFTNVNYESPYYFFMPKNYDAQGPYNSGFSLEELFPVNVTGIVTARDSVVIDFNKKTLHDRIKRFCDFELSDKEIRSWLFPGKKDGKYSAGDSRGWKLPEARKKIAKNDHNKFIKMIGYRPFDDRYIYYSPDMVDWGREKIMGNLLKPENIGIVYARQSTDENWTMIQLSRTMIDNRFHFSYKGIPMQSPLYLYPLDDERQTKSLKLERQPNVNKEIIVRIAESLKLKFTSEKDNSPNTFCPMDMLDYIYAVLHSPTYRKKYREFLRIDFPRVPYPSDKKMFWELVKLGGRLRSVHLFEDPISEKYITKYPEGGNNKVEGIEYDSKKVWINSNQYFDNVPKVAWDFYVGGYQPAQKWLKDRKGHRLTYDDIMHYQKIIVALFETDKIMQENDKISMQ
jgi:predicted helicase